MAKGQAILILIHLSAVISQYDIRKAPASLEDRYVTDTQNWMVNERGERTCVITTRSSPDVCYLRFDIGNVKYLDCRDEYLFIGQEKICGELKEYYQYPFTGENVLLTYRGRRPLQVVTTIVKCGESQKRDCDLITRDLTVEIASPNYPNEYPTGVNCQYAVLPANEAICQVSILIHDLDVEDSPGCEKDKLLIGDEPFCGRTKNYRVNRNLTNNLIMRFVSDGSVGGSGFRMTVEQIHCGNSLGQRVLPGGECCEREYRHPYMVLTSPGFLSDGWTNSDCVYSIYPSHPNVCRLRFRFVNFWVGEEDVFYGCVNGFVEIDRTRFCGCLDGYEHVSYFDGDRRKELHYLNQGPGNRGFVMEVYQEECTPETNGTEVDPDNEIEVFMTNVTSEKAVSRFLIPRDASRCLHPDWIRRAGNFLASARVPTHCRLRPDGYSPATASQFQPGGGPPALPFPSEPVLPPFFGLPPPLPPPIAPPVPPPIPRPEPILPPNYIILGQVRGQFASIGYPNRYPPYLRIHYVFAKVPGFCTVEVQFREFDLEKSLKCWKDYLLVDGRARYCGQYLMNKRIALYFQQRDSIFLDFVTDGCFAGRGFYAEYTQRPCLRPFGSLLRRNDTLQERETNGGDSYAVGRNAV